MGTIKIINNSTFTDVSVIFRVGYLLSGDEDTATRDHNGKAIVCIKKKGNSTYLVTDATENPPTRRPVDQCQC